MPDPNYDIPAEVRAAQRALGQKAIPDVGTVGGPAEISTPVRISSAVDELLTIMLEADRVDIIGVLPWRCAARLIEFQRELERQRKDWRLPSVRYFTPSSARITLYRHKEILGPVVRRWVAGINGLRNWLRTGPPNDPESPRPKIYEFDDIYLDCLIYTSAAGRGTEITLLSQLPELKADNPMSPASDVTDLVISRMSSDQLDQLDKYRQALVAKAHLMVPRHILCRPDTNQPEPQTPGSEFKPTILRLHPAHMTYPEGTASVGALIAVCCSTARGNAILLKMRTPRNSYDDLGKLSLLSERVHAEDMSAALSGQLNPDDDRALEELWLQAGRPRLFEIPEASFRHAAQRELFMTCGLDVPADRLEYRGACFLERDTEEKEYLGLYIYRLELMRDAVFDELAYAQSWGEDLKLVLLSEMYQPAIRRRLHPLLREREAWIKTTVLPMRSDNNVAPGEVS